MSKHNAALALKTEDRPAALRRKPQERMSVAEFRDQPEAAKRTNKFGAKKTEVDGILFASKAEAERYGTLKLLERARQVRAVSVQPEFALKINGHTIGHYSGDFAYYEGGKLCVDDVKGMITEAASLRMRVFMACFPDIELRIVDGQGRVKKFKQRQVKERRLAA